MSMTKITPEEKVPFIYVDGDNVHVHEITITEVRVFIWNDGGEPSVDGGFINVPLIGDLPVKATRQLGRALGYAADRADANRAKGLKWLKEHT